MSSADSRRAGEHRCNRFLVSIFHVENWPVHPGSLIYGAVGLRKNLSKCVISPLMEHRRKAILLIPPFSCSFGLFSHSLPPLLFMLFDVSISLPALHLSTLPSFERVTFLTHRFGRGDCGCISAPVLTEGFRACVLIHIAKIFH